MLVRERKIRLDGSQEDFMCERLLLEPGKRAVLRYRVDREWRVADGALVVPAGSVNLAHYWMDRPYNVYQFMAAGRTLAYYCNVAEPTAIREDLVEYLDLAVDVLIRPSGEAASASAFARLAASASARLFASASASACLFAFSILRASMLCCADTAAS